MGDDCSGERDGRSNESSRELCDGTDGLLEESACLAQPHNEMASMLRTKTGEGNRLMLVI